MAFLSVLLDTGNQQNHKVFGCYTLYQLFLARSERHRADPPAHWDPVFSHLSK
jgi:hypothetical protein